MAAAIDECYTFPKDPDAVKAFLDEKRLLDFDWASIAKMLGWSSRTLRRWREDYQYMDPRQSLDDLALDEKVLSIVNNIDQIGSEYVWGVLKGEGYCITRDRVRQSVRRVNPEGIEIRKTTRLQRRVYAVHGPMHLWHIDSNHKLIKYNMVIHGCIDGFSKTVIYLHCADNNRASTVLDIFTHAVEQTWRSVPYRIRTDGGGENIRIAEYMQQMRPNVHRPCIAGRSVHNQRIERLWRDVTDKVTSFYADLFILLETVHHVDFNHPLVLFLVHYLYLDRINEHLERFQSGWNHHKLRTEHNKSPLQLLHCNLDALPPPPELIVDPATYGLHDDAFVEAAYPATPFRETVVLEPLAVDGAHTGLLQRFMDEVPCRLALDESRIESHVEYFLQCINVLNTLSTIT